MSSASSLYPKKPKPPVVRVVYTLTAANGNYLKTQDGKNITVKY
jgi:hypothetical protein